MSNALVGCWVRGSRLARGALPAIVIALLSAGCVPYSVHRQAKDEIVRLTDANADLIKKYNSAMLQLMSKEKAGGVVPADYESLKDEVARLRAEAANKVRPSFSRDEIKEVGAEDEEGGIALGEALLFAEGSDKLKREASPILDRLVSVLKKDHPSEPVIIEGHTDNQPLVKTLTEFGDNMVLGFARAHAVASYLMSKGIPESRMICMSYSFNKPLDPASASTKEGRRQNRRVVVRLATLKL